MLGSVASGNNSVALGTRSRAEKDDVFSIGRDGIKRKLVNMAAVEVSATSTGALNGSQMYETNQAVAADTAAIFATSNQVATNSAQISATAEES